MAYFGFFSIGIVMSVGALCVSVADTPGPVRHRANGMLACIILVTAVSILTPLAAVNTVLLGGFIFIAGFVFSMFTVYGTRSAFVGIAAMLIMVLGLQEPKYGSALWLHALYTLVGGIWYMLYSLLLYRIRPYKFIEQVLADYIEEVAGFLRLRGSLYGNDPDYDKIEQELLLQQINIENQQAMLSELIFKTRAIVKESKHAGRVILKNYLEVADLYESVMTSYQQYPVLHEHFEETGILKSIKSSIDQLAAEMQEISFSIKSGIYSEPDTGNIEAVQKLKQDYEILRREYMNEANIEYFVSLGKIVGNLQSIAGKIKKLHFYRARKSDDSSHKADVRRFRRFAPTEDIRPSLFVNNLNFQSNIFRHAVRMAFALLAGFILSSIFQLSHGYWVLLTIVVILKPAYSLSKIRNKDRLIGTLAGLVIGVVVLLIIKNEVALLVVMILFMAASNTFIRTNYFVSVMLMTPYLIIFFHFLYPGIIRTLLVDRMIDTAIGSGIAFLASKFLVPAWEMNSIKLNMVNMLLAADKYYATIALNFTRSAEWDMLKIRIARQEILVHLSNLSNAFTRMLSEPKWTRLGQQEVHRFVVLSHNLISHLAALSYLLQEEKNTFRHTGLIPVIEKTRLYFSSAIALLDDEQRIENINHEDVLQVMNEDVMTLIEKRKAEILAGQLETPTKKILVDTKSVTDQFNYVISDASTIYKICREYKAVLDKG
jgi:uncharacterized membrane protein (TIGR01666 family)